MSMCAFLFTFICCVFAPVSAASFLSLSLFFLVACWMLPPHLPCCLLCIYLSAPFSASPQPPLPYIFYWYRCSLHFLYTLYIHTHPPPLIQRRVVQIVWYFSLLSALFSFTCRYVYTLFPKWYLIEFNVLISTMSMKQIIGVEVRTFIYTCMRFRSLARSHLDPRHNPKIAREEWENRTTRMSSK